jgi:hypothetical protein
MRLPRSSTGRPNSWPKVTSRSTTAGAAAGDGHDGPAWTVTGRGPDGLAAPAAAPDRSAGSLQHGEDPFGTGERGLHGLPLVPEGGQRGEEAGEVQHEGGEGADADPDRPEGVPTCGPPAAA